MADPVLLEPIMRVEVTTPMDNMGDRDRRPELPPRSDQSMKSAAAHGGRALVPLSEMFGYVGDLRSKTSGRPSYSMVFDSYA